MVYVTIVTMQLVPVENYKESDGLINDVLNYMRMN